MTWVIPFKVSPEVSLNFHYTAEKLPKEGEVINLEKALKYGDRVSGHFVQGHVDTTCSVKKINLIGQMYLKN